MFFCICCSHATFYLLTFPLIHHSPDSQLIFKKSTNGNFSLAPLMAVNRHAHCALSNIESPAIRLYLRYICHGSFTELEQIINARVAYFLRHMQKTYSQEIFRYICCFTGNNKRFSQILTPKHLQ